MTPTITIVIAGNRNEFLDFIQNKDLGQKFIQIQSPDDLRGLRFDASYFVGTYERRFKPQTLNEIKAMIGINEMMKGLKS